MIKIKIEKHITTVMRIITYLPVNHKKYMQAIQIPKNKMLFAMFII